MKKLKDKLNWRAQPDLPKLEESVLEHWQENRVFEKSVSARPKDKQYVFYDGPPFATGMPHYGHLVASTTKDVIPRYFTMKGYRVERQWGWDCHGLPIENILEKELKLPDKKSIEDYGVDKFNEACRSTVLKYADEWKKVIARIGRWVDMENDYKTMEPWYMESLWWVFKELWQKNLIYQGYKSMHICPRCSTPLSNFEVTQGYKDVTDISAYVEFKLTNPGVLTGEKSAKDVYLIAWTTTPWTLPGNALLAVNPKLKYVMFEGSEPNNLYIVAEARIKELMGDSPYQIIKTLKASELTGLTYEPLFAYFQDTENAFKVVAGEFVTTEEGTGVVHIAPAFGEDDYQLGLKHQVPLVQHVGMDGKFTSEVGEFAHLPVKPKNNPTQTDQKIVEYLEKHDRLFFQSKLTHSYPHCWRCDTPLLNYATSSWFVKVTQFKQELLANNQAINWVPKHIRDGRFGTWLENVRDWAISRNRFWGTPLPIWQAEDGETLCIGSISELEELTGKKVTDLHKHFIDQLIINKNGKTFRRIPEVLDCWFESGAMPYASFHYPFEKKAEFEHNFPAEFISEGQDQTRGWFYTLHVLATALTMGKNPAIPVPKTTSSFKNVIVNGVVLAADGKKMSKRLKNYPDPMAVVEKYGVDSLRLYLMSSPVMRGENLNFNEIEVAEIRKKIFLIWWNVVAFYQMFAGEYQFDPSAKIKANNVMDQWLLSRLNRLIDNVTQAMDSYDLVTASRLLMSFISELSNWYLRRSRDRFKDPQLVQESLQVLASVLYKLAQLFAPFAPFFSELIFSIFNTDQLSVHLTDWPQVDKKMIDDQLDQDMETVRKVAEKAHALRKSSNIKVRQPLAKAVVTGARQPSAALADVLKDEINVKLITWRANKSNTSKLEVELDTQLTPDLVAEGEARELIRNIQKLRKATDVEAKTPITVSAPSWPSSWQNLIEQKTNSVLTHGESLTIVDNSKPTT